jgi:hypothetical protein
MQRFLISFLIIGSLLILSYVQSEKPREVGNTHRETKEEVVEKEKTGGNVPEQSPHSLIHTVSYLRTHGELPNYYLTKREAATQGWVPSEGNLGEVLPGMMIGGDIFGNSERLLPAKKGRVWREADFDYKEGTRNAKRILYSNDGLIFVTYDHYKTVTQYDTL